MFPLSTHMPATDRHALPSRSSRLLSRRHERVDGMDGAFPAGSWPRCKAFPSLCWPGLGIAHGRLNKTNHDRVLGKEPMTFDATAAMINLGRQQCVCVWVGGRECRARTGERDGRTKPMPFHGWGFENSRWTSEDPTSHGEPPGLMWKPGCRNPGRHASLAGPDAGGLERPPSTHTVLWLFPVCYLR